MPCHHRNSNDLDLQYVDWEVKTLFIGTFNPAWKCPNNYSDWFYGRTQRNEFWCILPKVYNSASLLNVGRPEWIEFCRKNKIAITDILTCIDDADENNNNHKEFICNRFSDDNITTNFHRFTYTDILEILKRHPTISQVCITRQNINGFWGNSLAPTQEYCLKNNIRFIPLRSPSRGARRGVIGRFCDFVANRWIQQGFIPNP